MIDIPRIILAIKLRYLLYYRYIYINANLVGYFNHIILYGLHQLQEVIEAENSKKKLINKF